MMLRVRFIARKWVKKIWFPGFLDFRIITAVYEPAEHGGSNI
jgi:hypothetical protein